MALTLKIITSHSRQDRRIPFFTTGPRTAFNALPLGTHSNICHDSTLKYQTGMRGLPLSIGQDVSMPDEDLCLSVYLTAPDNTNWCANTQNIFLLSLSFSPCSHTKPGLARLCLLDPLRPVRTYARRLSLQMWSRIDMSITTSSIVRFFSSQVAVEIMRCGVLESCEPRQSSSGATLSYPELDHDTGGRRNSRFPAA